ncbi:MAG: type VI secretion system baseplate subunit TssG [Leptospirillum sp.]|jgi:type VI secretion system protein ImpH
MARAAGHPDTDLTALKNDLESAPDQYTFTQVIRLIRLVLSGRENASPKEELWRQVRVRPALALGSPHKEICSLSFLEDRQAALLDVNFFGLYGVSSPLPLFYTEDLIAYNNDDNTAPRDFLDILHGALYPLLYDSWKKYRLSLRAYEEEDQSALDCFHVFTGLSDPLFASTIRAGDSLFSSTIRYAGLLTQHPRSAKGLESILSDVLGEISVEIEQCPEKSVPIPKDQLLILGHSQRLGEETVIGETIVDRNNQIRIRIGPVENDGFDRLLPGNEDFEKVSFWQRFYLVEPVMAWIEVVLKDEKPVPVCLGEIRRTRLGLDSWLENEFHTPVKTVRFPLQPQTMEGSE